MADLTSSTPSAASPEQDRDDDDDTSDPDGVTHKKLRLTTSGFSPPSITMTAGRKMKIKAFQATTIQITKDGAAFALFGGDSNSYSLQTTFKKFTVVDDADGDYEIQGEDDQGVPVNGTINVKKPGAEPRA